MKAVIFDMDGVIVDSEAHWRILEDEFYRSTPRWKEEHHERLTGMGVEDVYRFLRRECGLEMSWEQFLERSEATARKVYLEKVRCAAGFADFIDKLRRLDLKTGLASSSPRRWIDYVLERFQLTPMFDAVVSADDVRGRTKPLPDLYLEAMQRLGMSPQDCLAVEDSTAGVGSAKAAGLTVAAFLTDHNSEQDLSRADLFVRSFVELGNKVLC